MKTIRLQRAELITLTAAILRTAKPQAKTDQLISEALELEDAVRWYLQRNYYDSGTYET